MQCDELNRSIEAIADGTWQPDSAALGHLSTCPACAARINLAGEIESFLANRETVEPSETFTADVMARIVNQSWHAERVVDLGFNLAIAAGILVILAGGAGAAWSLGLLSVEVDLRAVAEWLAPEMTNRVLSQAQTVMIGAVLLTAALVFWWWAEAESA